MMLQFTLILLAPIAITSALSVPRDVSQEVNQHINIDLSGHQILKYLLLVLHR
jgi:hypothetical protein